MSNFLDLIPAGQPPSGEESNFINPKSKGHTVVILDAIFFSFMTVAVLIRLFVRARILKMWGWDDTACVIAALGSLSHTILYPQMVKIGYGRHIWDIPASWLAPVEHARLMSTNGITYPFTILFVKLSILLFYKRIFHVSKTLNKLVFVTAIILALFYTAMIGVAIAAILKCNGLQALSLPLCKAFSGPIVLLNGSFNVVSDIWILALPFAYIYKLKLYPRQRIRLIVLFGLGILVCAASLARLIDFAIYYGNPDVFWAQATNAFFTIIEMNVAIIISCASTFPPFYLQTKRQIHSTASTLRTRILSTPRRSDSLTHQGEPTENCRTGEFRKNSSNTEGENQTELQDLQAFSNV